MSINHVCNMPKDVIVSFTKEGTDLNQKSYVIRISLLGIILLVMSFWVVSNVQILTVYCHPKPLVYTPQPHQVFDSVHSGPNRVIITFTERPELVASKIQVMDSKNGRVDNRDLELEQSEKSLSISLDKSKLMSGLYTVKWVVLSKDDGFITKGSYTFSIT